MLQKSTILRSILRNQYTHILSVKSGFVKHYINKASKCMHRLELLIPIPEFYLGYRSDIKWRYYIEYISQK